MKKILFIATLYALLVQGVVSCSTTEDPVTKTNNPPKDTTGTGGGGAGETGLNLNPDFSFYFNGMKVEFSKIQADYGGKTYLTGFDKAQRFVLDLTLPVAKGVLAQKKVFTIENDQYTGMGMFIDPDDKKWFLEGGTINITKNSANTLSGNFSAKAILIDFTEPLNPVRTDSTNITNGVFNNLKVKG